MNSARQNLAEQLRSTVSLTLGLPMNNAVFNSFRYITRFYWLLGLEMLSNIQSKSQLAQ